MIRPFKEAAYWLRLTLTDKRITENARHRRLRHPRSSLHLSVLNPEGQEAVILQLGYAA